MVYAISFAIWIIGIPLLYFNQRIQKEGFDIEMQGPRPTTVESVLRFITHPDRGPNADAMDVDEEGGNERPFPLPDYQAQWIRYDSKFWLVTVPKQRRRGFSSVCSLFLSPQKLPTYGMP